MPISWRSITPARLSRWSRADSSAGEMRGTPRRRAFEGPAAFEQLPDHEHRPAFVQELHRLCHRTELAVRTHGREGARRFSTGGVYINFLTEDEGEDRLRASYGANLDRLARVKAAWDPDNVFRLNKNIAPRA